MRPMKKFRIPVIDIWAPIASRISPMKREINFCPRTLTRFCSKTEARNENHKITVLRRIAPSTNNKVVRVSLG